ncbi:MFS transporter [Bosea lathyri]|uniref:MFS transporter, PPP family, 3-phenylpropionic acid transporter n=1 Tax=Bosea lathyri TaxID=1036778 RepID=A0A1H6D3S3_9HYPH|nr:MFS transporter [Bosea lathyri]SEG79266.1 MFS transporter, PPP family, 3-phenylpropionic acid transporter [Bosea lathyri]
MDRDRRAAVHRTPLPRFVLLYALMYGAFGVASPFWPRFFEERGATAEELGVLLAAGTAARLVSGPLAGRMADLLAARRAVLGACIGTAGVVALALLPAQGLWLLLLVSLCHAAALAPVTTLADALASRAAATSGRAGGRRFEYGWVRGAGSAVFIIGTLVAGQVVGATGLPSIVLMHGALLAAAAVVALFVPEVISDHETTLRAGSPAGGFAALLRIALFRRLLLVVALVLGSHAMHDAFAVIRWNAAGIGPGAASVLWSTSVAAEVLVFFLIGPPLVARAGPAAAAAIAAAAGALRWIVMALTADPLVLMLTQPLHGLTFALLHLACMRLLTQTVPPQLAATGQAIYALAAGTATALLTLAAGALYARFGAAAFFAMAALCVGALPLTLGLRAQSR